MTMSGRAMQRPVHVNGRFLAQPFSGVQRFATEITAALLAGSSDADVLVPGGTTPPSDIAFGDACRPVGRLGGHVWEQTELRLGAAGGVLVNLGNTAPLLFPRQVVVIHDCGWATTPEAYSRSFRLVYRLLQRRLVRSGARIVTVSAFARGEIVRHLGADPAAVTVIREGADHMARIAPEPGVLAAHGLERGRYVLAVGNLAAHKNLSALSSLARELASRGLVLAIAGAVRDGIFRAADGAMLPSPARRLGRVSDGALRTLYENAACYVFPSRYEGFGLPALEAMACGAPVVAADIPALREVCGDGALFADPGAPDAIAAAVCAILDTPLLAARLVAEGGRRARSFVWADAANALGRIARSLASPGPTRLRPASPLLRAGARHPQGTDA